MADKVRGQIHEREEVNDRIIWAEKIEWLAITNWMKVKVSLSMESCHVGVREKWNLETVETPH